MKKVAVLSVLALFASIPLLVSLSCSATSPTSNNFQNPVQTIAGINPSFTPTFTFTPTNTLTSTPTSTPTASFTPYVVATWTGFTSPSAVASDAAGNIYVADTGDNHVGKYSPAGILVATWGSGGVKGKIPFVSPVGVAVNSVSQLFVVGSGNQVSQYNAAGGLMTSAFSSTATFSGPQGVAVDAGGNVYVSDSGNNRIIQLNSGGGLAGFGGSGILSLGPSTTIGGVTINSAVTLAGLACYGGSVFVATQGTGVNGSSYSSVLGFDTATGNTTTAAIPGFMNPSGVAFDSSGNLYVADTGNKQFEEFTAGSFTQLPLIDNGSSNLQNPKGIAVDPFFNIYITDSGANKIFKFAP